MQKRLISILLIFFILIPNTAFAAETTPPTENIQLQEEPAESQSTDIQEPAAPETPDVPPEEPSNPDTPEIPDEPEEPSTTEELQEKGIQSGTFVPCLMKLDEEYQIYGFKKLAYDN